VGHVRSVQPPIDDLAWGAAEAVPRTQRHGTRVILSRPMRSGLLADAAPPGAWPGPVGDGRRPDPGFRETRRSRDLALVETLMPLARRVRSASPPWPWPGRRAGRG